MDFDINSYKVADFPYTKSFSQDLTNPTYSRYFLSAIDFVATYFYGVIYDLIPRLGLPEDIKDKKAKIFVDNAIAWYLTDFYGNELGATTPTTGLLPISQKNIGGIFVGFAQTQTQEAIKTLESNKFGVLALSMFKSFKERYSLYR